MSMRDEYGRSLAEYPTVERILVRVIESATAMGNRDDLRYTGASRVANTNDFHSIDQA